MSTQETEATTGAPSFFDRLLLVLRAWWKQPSQVATVMPSSSHLIRTVANCAPLSRARLVVELGPGAGGTTAGFLAKMRPDAKLLAIEKTKELIEPLRTIADHRLIVVHGDAADLTEILKQHELESPDVVISGIPFSSIPDEVASQITRSVHDALSSNGEFIAYQLKSDIEEFATPLFGRARKDFVPLNVPPLTVYSWSRSSTAESD